MKTLLSFAFLLIGMISFGQELKIVCAIRHGPGETCDYGKAFLPAPTDTFDFKQFKIIGDNSIIELPYDKMPWPLPALLWPDNIQELTLKVDELTKAVELLKKEIERLKKQK